MQKLYAEQCNIPSHIPLPLWPWLELNHSGWYVLLRFYFYFFLLLDLFVCLSPTKIQMPCCLSFDVLAYLVILPTYLCLTLTISFTFSCQHASPRKSVHDEVRPLNKWVGENQSQLTHILYSTLCRSCHMSEEVFCSGATITAFVQDLRGQ